MAEAERKPLRGWALGLSAALALAGGALAGLLLAKSGHDGGALRPVTAENPENAASLGRLIEHPSPIAIADIAFNDAEGKAHHLSEWRGKMVLLNLWATWCAPCKQEMPSLDRLQARLGGPSFVVLALSTDRAGPAAPSAFFASQGIGHLDVLNDASGEASLRLKAAGLPLTLILDKEGREVARQLGPADWDDERVIARLEGLFPRAGG